MCSPRRYSYLFHNKIFIDSTVSYPSTTLRKLSRGHMKGERRVRQRLFVRFNFIYQRITYREGITYPDYSDTPLSPRHFYYVNKQRGLNF